jgi:hypothetical protein
MVLMLMVTLEVFEELASNEGKYAGHDGRQIVLTNNRESARAQGAGADMKEANKMPRGNGRGPDGLGPMTGRGAGSCAGNENTGYANAKPGRGLGRGMGRGTGRGLGRGSMGYGRQAGLGRGYAGVPYTAPTNDQELEGLRGALKDIQKRIQSLESSAGEAQE